MDIVTRVGPRLLLGVSVAALTGVAAPPPPASACSISPSSARLVEGMIGQSTNSSSWASVAPRNAVFLDASPLASHPDVELVADGEFPWFHPEPLLVPGSEIADFGRTVIITETIDTTPPTTPRVHSAEFRAAGPGGCASHCGNIDAFEILYDDSRDENSLSSHLAYLISGGDSAEDARTAPTVRVLVAPYRGRILLHEGTFRPSVARFVALAAVDQAGNVSEPSAAVRIRTP